MAHRNWSADTAKRANDGITSRHLVTALQLDMTAVGLFHNLTLENVSVTYVIFRSKVLYSG